MPPSVATRIASLKASVETPRSAATCRLGMMTQLGPIELCRRALTASRRRELDPAGSEGASLALPTTER